MELETLETQGTQATVDTTRRTHGGEETYPQTIDARAPSATARAEPVDVNKIVRAVSRCCVGLTDVDPLRVATKTISGLYDGATTRELDQLSIQTAAGADRRGAAVRASSPRACWRPTSTRKCATRRSTPSRSRSRTAHRLGLVNDRLARFVADNARKLNDAIVAERDREFEYFGLRTALRPLPAQAPADAPGDRDAAAVLPAHRLRAVRDGADALELYRLFSTLEYLPSSPTLFNAGTRHEQLSSCFLLDSPEDHLAGIYQKLHRRRDAVEVLGRHRPRVPPRALARLADREHQRPLERHRAVAEDARRLGRGGEPGRQAQGRLLRLPRAVARRHRGVPRAARQHRRRGAAARTT